MALVTATAQLDATSSMRYLRVDVSISLPITDTDTSNAEFQVEETQTIDLVSEVHRVFEETVAHTVPFDSGIPLGPVHGLNITQLLVGSESTSVKHNLDFLHSIIGNQILGRSINQSIAFESKALGVAYDSEGNVINPCVPRVLPDPEVSVTGIGGTVILGIPEIGDSFVLKLNTIIRDGRGGEASQGVPISSVVEDTRSFTFSGVDETLKDSMQTFILANLGKEITLTDPEGIVGQCVITNPATAIAEERLIRNSNNCTDPEDLSRRFTVNLEFLGA